MDHSTVPAVSAMDVAPASPSMPRNRARRWPSRCRHRVGTRACDPGRRQRAGGDRPESGLRNGRALRRGNRPVGRRRAGTRLADGPSPRPALAASVGALISPAVSNQVAQSFGALADAVDYKNRTSFDDMAREMLRPMLQEWLDDNLPTLVERLVREEIERVARGGTR